MGGHRALRLAAGALAVIVVLVAALSAWERSRQAEAKPALGLFTSLPLYWPETASIGETLDRDAARHWARGALEQTFALEPLGTLDKGNLARVDRLLLAQPRPLSPAENVALDDWVRGGGRLLLFADPLLTEESRFPIGDKRRPQDVALLSPLLARWGLELTFDEQQDDTRRFVRWELAELPVRIGGRWRAVPPGAAARCTLAADGLVADCRIGTGRVLAVADAALLEGGSPQEQALGALGRKAFAR